MSVESSSVRLWCENLAGLLRQGGHVHGGLRIEIGGRRLPALGYFGPDDVCLGEWLRELEKIATVFGTRENGRHVYDEGEQGQPAFVFEREGERAFVTIAASEISDGEADPDWQRAEFSPQDFLAAYRRFRADFLATLRHEDPNAAAEWHQSHGSPEPLGPPAGR